MTPTNMIIAGLALALTLVAGAFGWQTVRLANEQKAHQTTVADFATLREKQATQAKADVEAARTEEHRRIFALEGVIHEQAKLAASARADADAATVALDRLRNQANRLAASANNRPTDTPATTASPTAEPAAMVLADVLGRLGQRAVDLGKFADESRRAGLTCEASYDALKESQ